MPHVRIASTGGTIASTSSETKGKSGKTPSQSGDDLVDAVPEIGEEATIDVEEVCQVSGFQMNGEALEALAGAIDRAAADGVDGVVVTHGTDTMAESAYALDLACAATTELPVVFTGAQRSFDQLGTDGPTNLLAAVRTAAHERVRDAGGVYLTFNDTVHAARWVVKGHTSALETFESPGAGPVGEFTPDGLRFFREPRSYSMSMPDATVNADVRVEIVTNALGVDGRQVERALSEEVEGGRTETETAVDGIVVAGTGLGNTTAELGTALESAIDAGVPVVLTSRCHAGTTAGVYGGEGGGQTLLEAGAISGGDLPPWKARLTLELALSRGDDLDAVREQFGYVDSIV
ncbi:asparaginase [Halobacteria archaeon AArc-m2/3/4]|uniref:Asparaginase n=1 Tax=Natronoglomus mannanivorans TaxID=2979990 RepID=A0ABT2QAN6_9EURY|nr:asparaginase [Halobacteria archaeon AArc-m2/3/4]